MFPGSSDHGDGVLHDAEGSLIMGKATLELPDPLKQTSKAPDKATPQTGLAGTDDLLSQLAGQEIDRLLAEAEVVGEGAAPGDAEVPQEAGSAPEELPTVQVAPVAEPAAEPAEAAGGDGQEKSILTAQGEVAAQLDELFAKLNDPTQDVEEETAPEPEAQMPVEAPPPPSPSPAAASEPLDSAAAVAAELEADEKLKRPLATQAAALEAAVASIQVSQEPEIPTRLRPLVWINAPFDALPANVRNALGQIGIVTMVNAVAVLLYVWLFRGKP
jgi:hypothetical protein